MYNIRISQGSVATVGFLMIALSQIFREVCLQKNENRLIFSKDMGKSLVTCF